jgi:hypothetical protein
MTNLWIQRILIFVVFGIFLAINKVSRSSANPVTGGECQSFMPNFNDVNCPNEE